MSIVKIASFGYKIFVVFVVCLVHGHDSTHSMVHRLWLATQAVMQLGICAYQHHTDLVLSENSSARTTREVIF